MDPAVARGDADVEADEAGAPVGVAAAVAEGVGAVAVAVAAAAEEGAGVVVAVAVVTAVSWEAGRRAAAATAGAVGGVGEGCKGCGGGGVSRGSIVGPDWGSPGTTYQGRGRPPVGWSDVVDPFCTTTSEAEMFELYACYKSVVSTEKREERDGCCPRSGRRRKYTCPPAVYVSSNPAVGCTGVAPLEGKRNDDSLAPGTLLRQRHGGRRQSRGPRAVLLILPALSKERPRITMQ